MLTALWLVTSAASLTGGLAADAPYSSARLLAQADLPGPTVDRMALSAERTRLVESRPGLGFPIAMMSIGAPLSFLFIGLTASLASNANYYYSTVAPETYAVLGLLIAGAVGMVAIGVVSLIFRLQTRNETDARLKVIDRQIGPADPRFPVPDENFPPPPPPGPPPPPPGPDPGPPGPPPPPPPPLATLLTF